MECKAATVEVDESIHLGLDTKAGCSSISKECQHKECHNKVLSVVAIPSSEAHKVWAEAEEWVGLALSQFDTGYGSEDILTEIQLRNMQLWMVPGYAACVTSIQYRPKHKAAVVAFLGGKEMHLWFSDLMGVIEAWAKESGCKYLEEYGRGGWIKEGKKLGWEKFQTVMRKTL